MSGTARAAQGDKRVKVSSTTGSRKDGGASEKVVETVTVERYWPSKAPKWAAGEEEEEKGFVPSASASSAPPPVAVDRRLQRLAERGALTEYDFEKTESAKTRLAQKRKRSAWQDVTAILAKELRGASTALLYLHVSTTLIYPITSSTILHR